MQSLLSKKELNDKEANGFSLSIEKYMHNAMEGTKEGFVANVMLEFTLERC